MFSPILPASGIGGWQYLQRTYDDQLKLFSKSPQLDRDLEYFKNNISKVSTADDLVSDRRLLTVALGAFGLQEDINNKFFVQKILEEGTTARDSLANRFTDNRYKELSSAFALGPGEESRIAEPEFVDDIVQRFEANSFEAAVGQQNDNMRIALYAQRVLADLVTPETKSREQEALEEISLLVEEFAEETETEANYFERNIGTVATVDEFVADRRMLEFALTAFGLEDEFEAIDSFTADNPGDVNEAEERIKAVLSEGSIAVTARANELDDPRYVELSRAFGFGFAETLKTNDFGFTDTIFDQYVEQNFQVPSDIDYDGPIEISNRALVFEPFEPREMANDTKWLTIMGEPPLRALFERAFNLPTEFGQADIDQQLEVFKQRARAEFSTDNLTEIASPQNIDSLITKFLARSQLGSFNASANSASIALTLLQS